MLSRNIEQLEKDWPHVFVASAQRCLLLDATFLQKAVKLDSFVARLLLVNAVKDAKTYEAIIVKAALTLAREATQVLYKIAAVILQWRPC